MFRGQGARPPGQVDREPARGRQFDDPGQGLGGNGHPGRAPRTARFSATRSRASPTWAPTPRTSPWRFPCWDCGWHRASTRFPTHFQIDCVVTHTMTTDAYRGAGRPEAIYYLERIIDMYAREIGMDPLEVRKKNYWKPDQFPATMGCGFSLDSGNYEASVDALMEKADYAGLRTDAGKGAVGRPPSSGSGSRPMWRFAGSGRPSWPRSDSPGRTTDCRLRSMVRGWYGSIPTGPPPCSSEPGLPARAIRPPGPRSSPTDSAFRSTTSRCFTATPPSPRWGSAPFGSRSIAVDGAATHEATPKDPARRRPRSSPTCWKPRRTTSSLPMARRTWPDRPTTRPPGPTSPRPRIRLTRLPEGWESGLEAHGSFSPGNATWPFGTHLAVVEVDPETGNVTLLKYVGAGRLRECRSIR